MISYAEPRRVDSLTECAFYHVMDLPAFGRVGGQWDLRGTVDDYLGRFDFRDKRALDIGAASGFLTFAMERRGARRLLRHRGRAGLGHRSLRRGPRPLVCAQREA